MCMYTSMQVYMPMCMYVCLYINLYVCVPKHDLVCSLDPPPAAVCRLGVTLCCLALSGGWDCIKVEGAMRGGAGMGLISRGYVY